MNHSPPNFSHIYVEERALSFPETTMVIKKFGSAVIVPIRHYKDVFNRPRQDRRAQKTSPNLILALRQNNFLYPGSCLSDASGNNNFYYNSLVLNCLYDCDYCYLQGLYPSANMVLFINNNDYFTAVLKTLQTNSPLFLCISYETDLLALERIFPYCRKWIEFTSAHPDLTIELRTKSADYEAIANLKPPPNVLLAWTLSPAEIIARYEHRTPALPARLKAVRRALAAGWQVRLSFDPLLLVPQWEVLYRDFIHDVFKNVAPSRIKDVTLGVFRMNSRFLKKIHSQRLEPDILYYPFDLSKRVASYNETHKRALMKHIYTLVQEYLPRQKIHQIE